MGQPDLPLISVVVPCYNQGAFLREAVESALGQTYPRVEVIVVDDGSTDETPTVAARFGSRIRTVRRENGGLPAARNTGIAAARGKSLLFLDADDFLRPGMLAQLVEVAMRAGPDVITRSAVQHVDLAGRPIDDPYVAPMGDDAFHALLAGNVFPCHSALVPRSLIQKVGSFDPALRSCEDWDLWLRLAAAGGVFVAVPSAVAVYRRYPGSMSTDPDRMWQSGLMVLGKHRKYHADCQQCRAALAEGHQTLRQLRYDLVRKELTRYRGSGDAATGVARAMRATLRTPYLAGLFMARHLTPLYRAARYVRHRAGSVNRRFLGRGSQAR